MDEVSLTMFLIKWGEDLKLISIEKSFFIPHNLHIPLNKRSVYVFCMFETTRTKQIIYERPILCSRTPVFKWKAWCYNGRVFKESNVTIDSLRLSDYTRCRLLWNTVFCFLPLSESKLITFHGVRGILYLSISSTRISQLVTE